MNIEPREEVQQAVLLSSKARDEFSEAMYGISERLGYSDSADRPKGEKQQFGPPVSEERLHKLEATLGQNLPPSFRAFLKICDGWKIIDGSQSFFSIDELLEWRSRSDPQNWQAIAVEAGDDFVTECLVIGASDDSPDKYLLNPLKVNNDGEWQFIEYGREEHEVYPSLLDYLRATIEQFRESAKDFDPDEFFDPFAED